MVLEIGNFLIRLLFFKIKSIYCLTNNFVNYFNVFYTYFINLYFLKFKYSIE